MWSDNDTEIDLLGFQVHSKLIQGVVTRKAMLPVTVGLFGDWGSGKSSVMRMLRRDLEHQERIACISFNGWQFEGYDDAKTALIQSILEELKKNQHFGSRIKDKAENLIRRVNWFRLVGVGYQTFVMPVITSYLMAAAGIPPTPTSTPSPAPDKKSLPELSLDDLVNKNPANTVIQNVREFHAEFSELIKETGLDALVILVDDLDRCSPERLIDTLEAIKLFLAVPRVGFVIGTDVRLVRYAIAARYSSVEGEDELNSTKRSELVTDYVEKLIQVPYYLPRLAPNEIETYVNLLFCQLSLEDEDFKIVLDACSDGRKQKRTGIFGYLEIASALTSKQKTCSQELEAQITLSRMISPSLADILKGNPRQTKRLLNALLLRHQLAEVAGLQIEWTVLVKLMVLEYVKTDLFSELYHMQARQQGTPKEISAMEDAVNSPEKMSKDAFPSTSWQEQTVLNWLRMQPPLSQIDLRDYFWLTRDRLSGILAGVSLISPIIRTLLADMAGRESIAATPGFKAQVQDLQLEEQNTLLRELGSLLKRNPNNHYLFGNWVDLGVGIAEAATQLVYTLDQFTPSSIASNIPIAPMKLALLYQHAPQCKSAIDQLYAKWKTDSRLKNAVEDAQKSLSRTS